jgi:sugar O-acyltransferase (sialic acid O-acetyltransferase NeuD family)
MKPRVAFIGSGELAIHIAHYLVEDNQYEVVGFFDDYCTTDKTLDGYQFLGKISTIPKLFQENIFDKLIIAIGYTRMEYREELFNDFKGKIPFATFIHSSCYVDPTSKIGEGVIVLPKCLLYFNSVLEDNVFVQVNSLITDSVINSHTMISASVSIAGRCKIGKCCNLGIGTIVINDVTIADHVQTGGGAVVVKDILESGLYVGVPAKKIK